MRTPVTIIAALFAGAAVRSAVVYRALPVTMASHFGGSGQANGFMPRDGFFAFFALCGGGTVLLLLAIPWLTRLAPPSLINIPNRDYWLVPERLPHVHEKLRAWSAWYAAGTALFMVSVLELVLRANLTREPFASSAVEMLVVLALVGSALSIVLLVRSFRVPSL